MFVIVFIFFLTFLFIYAVSLVNEANIHNKMIRLEKERAEKLRIEEEEKRRKKFYTFLFSLKSYSWESYIDHNKYGLCDICGFYKVDFIKSRRLCICNECVGILTSYRNRRSRAHNAIFATAKQKGLLAHEREWRPDQWSKISWTVRNMDYNACAICKKNTGPMHVHHIIPISKGGSASSKINLVTLCPECHQKQHKHDILSSCNHR